MSLETILIESLDNHGHVQARHRFQLNEVPRKLTIGRSIHADLTLDDPYAAGLHAAIEVTRQGRVLASDLGSVNGLVVAGHRWHGVENFELADNTLQIGRTRLRVRTAQEVLRPEKPDHFPSSTYLARPAWIAAIAATACIAQTLYTTWLAAPRDLIAAAVMSLGLTAAVVAVWVSFWGLLSRIMHGEWRWARHTAIFLSIAAICTALIGLVDLGWYAFALPPWNHRQAWLAAVALGCALFLHLTSASNLRPRTAAQIALIVPLLLAAGNQWLQERWQRRNVNYIGEAMRIYPSMLRLRPASTIEAYFGKLDSLKLAADKKLTDVLANEVVDDK